MLKKRIIASLFLKNDIVVQSYGFKDYLPVGRADIAAEAFNNWGVDEIFLLDMDASREGRIIDLEIVRSVASKSMVPLAVGGGIKDIDSMADLLKAGADKICMNHSLLADMDNLRRGKEIYGRQCMVAVIDFMEYNGDYYVYDYLSRKQTGKSPLDLAVSYEEAGAGEILLNDVARNGSGLGYDASFINKISSSVSIPVVCCGGAGKPHDILNILQDSRVSGAAVGNYFHFCEHSISVVKAFINDPILIRMDSQFSYNKAQIADNGRLGKKSDEELEGMHYEKYEVEQI